MFDPPCTIHLWKFPPSDFAEWQKLSPDGKKFQNYQQYYRDLVDRGVEAVKLEESVIWVELSLTQIHTAFERMGKPFDWRVVGLLLTMDAAGAGRELFE